MLSIIAEVKNIATLHTSIYADVFLSRQAPACLPAGFPTGRNLAKTIYVDGLIANSNGAASLASQAVPFVTGKLHQFFFQNIACPVKCSA